MTMHFCSLALVTAAISLGLIGIALLATGAGIFALLILRRPRTAAALDANSVESASLISSAPVPPAPVVPTPLAPLAPPPLVPAAVAAIREIGPSPEILAIIAAAVRVTFGSATRVSQVLSVTSANPLVEPLMQHWSMEGRRQIYSSHQIR